ncbi:MAG: Gfo/Idh/MocA family oxidoreductase [Phycisphaerales bacterium]|nr:Gfo/Idh/MocA family oxidoreductase [Phycisphaerales bacterium]
MNRREFLKVSAAAAAGVTGYSRIMPRVLAASGLGANDQIRVGFIGAGRRARHLMLHEGLANHARIVAIADCFEPRCHEAAEPLEADGKSKVSKYQDYRKMLEREKLDAVFVVTTTHARTLVAIHAMQAGLDVYAEKPICLTVAEGRTLVKAARKYDRLGDACPGPGAICVEHGRHGSGRGVAGRAGARG